MVDSMDKTAVANILFKKAKKLYKKKNIALNNKEAYTNKLEEKINNICQVDKEDMEITLDQIFKDVFGPQYDLVCPTEKDEESAINSTPFLDNYFKGKFKRRLYDIDSNKKQLKKSSFNFIRKQVIEIANIKNIHTIESDFKHDTNKKREKENLGDTVMKIFKKYYGIEEDKLLASLITEKEIVLGKICKDKRKIRERQIKKLSKDEIDKNKSLLQELVEKTFKDVIIEYRKSDDFLKEAIKNSKGDKEKLKQYLLISMKYFNYLNCDEKKLKLEELKFDEELPKNLKDFYSNLDNFEFYSPNNQNSNSLSYSIDSNVVGVSSLTSLNTAETISLPFERPVEKNVTLASVISAYNSLSNEDKLKFIQELERNRENQISTNPFQLVERVEEDYEESFIGYGQEDYPLSSLFQKE